MAPGGTATVDLSVAQSAFRNSSLTTILPAPPGVSNPTPSGGVGYNPRAVSEEQREYNRRVHLLNLALEPLVRDVPPSDFDVLAMAWGADVPVTLDVQGRRARTEELSLWTSRLEVFADEQSNPVLKSSAAPLWSYAPTSNDFSWFPGPPTGSRVAPYADLQFKLPAGAKPQSLNLYYDSTGIQGSGAEWLIYNVRTGAWDPLGSVERAGASFGTANRRVVSISSPVDYTGPGGHVVLRLFSQASLNGVSLSPLYLTLNETP
jgi:hypothetical protein